MSLLNKFRPQKIKKEMIETVKQLKQQRPDLVELFENMNREQLLKQIYKESLDAINMEERVQTFMNECTKLSKTTYPIETIKQLIDAKKKFDLSDFCETTLEDIEGMELQEVIEYLEDFIILE